MMFASILNRIFGERAETFSPGLRDLLFKLWEDGRLSGAQETAEKVFRDDIEAHGRNLSRYSISEQEMDHLLSESIRGYDRGVR